MHLLQDLLHLHGGVLGARNWPGKTTLTFKLLKQ